MFPKFLTCPIVRNLRLKTVSVLTAQVTTTSYMSKLRKKHWEITRDFHNSSDTLTFFICSTPNGKHNVSAGKQGKRNTVALIIVQHPTKRYIHTCLYIYQRAYDVRVLRKKDWMDDDVEKSHSSSCCNLFADCLPIAKKRNASLNGGEIKKEGNYSHKFIVKNAANNSRGVITILSILPRNEKNRK